MVQVGFMARGATDVKRSTSLRNGIMRAGAMKQEGTNNSPAVQAKKEEKAAKEVISQIEDDVVEKPLEELHVFTLKKMAKEKGYEGDKFDKETLLEYLKTN